MKQLILFLFALHCVSLSIAQKRVPPLERMVTVHAQKETLAAILEKIATQTNTTFSYNPERIGAQRTISIHVKNKPLRSVLQELSSDQFTFKQRGDFIILTPKPKETAAQPKSPPKTISIYGYVYNAEGERLSKVSIYNTSNLIASVTNEYGYYSIEVPPTQLPMQVKIARIHYDDTSFVLRANTQPQDIILRAPALKNTTDPKQQKDTVSASKDSVRTSISLTDSTTVTPALPDSVLSRKKPFLQYFLLSDQIKTNLRNITDTAFTKTQIGLVPFVSTNKLLSGNTINDYSFNVLVGYAQGVNKFELGGLINIDRGNVKGVQIAGLINAVEGHVAGVQTGGWGNINKGRSEGVLVGGLFNIGTHMHGVQVAGITNINLSIPDSVSKNVLRDMMHDTVYGVQVAGITNINAGYTEGIRTAGIVNIGDRTKGVQVAGITNMGYHRSDGVQVAGITNIHADTSTGTQVAGIVNLGNRYFNGVQVAGIANVVNGVVRGTQFASMVNYAEKLEGTQFALLNFSDSASGLPIGLISFVHKGYKHLELSSDEILYTQLAFRTGVPKFHNIFIAGVDLTNRLDGLWTAGYGIGSVFDLNQKWQLGADLTAQMLRHKGVSFNQNSQLFSLSALAVYQLHPKMAIAFGPSFRTMTSEIADHQRLVPYAFYESTNGASTLRMWVGGKFAIRF